MKYDKCIKGIEQAVRTLLWVSEKTIYRCSLRIWRKLHYTAWDAETREQYMSTVRYYLLPASIRKACRLLDMLGIMKWAESGRLAYRGVISQARYVRLGGPPSQCLWDLTCANVPKAELTVQSGLERSAENVIRVL